MNTATTTPTHLFVQMVLTAWHGQNSKVDELLGKLSDGQFLTETAPGKNAGIYLLGHLAAVNDGLFHLLGIGERLHPELDKIFIFNADKSGQEMPSVIELKKYWTDINAALTEQFNKMNPEEWFTRHTKVSEEDFAKEPQRNKLNVIITRTIHQGYHLGQMNYLKSV